MYPLSTVKEGEEIEVCGFGCGCEQACRLRDLGCREGGKGKVISRQKNIIIQFGESRIAIDQHIAGNILVGPTAA